MDIVFLITTYRRKESCQRLVTSLQGQGDIIVLGDNVDYGITGCEFYNLPVHNGKLKYYQTVNKLWKLRGQHKYYFMLPDDCLPVDNFAEKAISTWNLIEDTEKICISTAEGRPFNTCWTRFTAEEKDHAWLSQWVDMCFLCEDKFFYEVGILPHTHASTHGSSGVGAYISRLLYRKRFNMYQVKESLVVLQPEHDTSQMHSNDNKTNTGHRKHPKQKRVFDTRTQKHHRTGG